MNNEKGAAVLEGKEGKRKGSEEGEGEEKRREKKRATFLARSKLEAKFEDNSTFIHVPYSFKAATLSY